MKNRDYLKGVEELLSLTQKALQFAEKKDLSKVQMISIRRNKILSKLKFHPAPPDKLDIARDQLENIQEINASIKAVIEAELSEIVKRVSLVKKELKLRDRFIGARRIKRRIINGKV